MKSNYQQQQQKYVIIVILIGVALIYASTLLQWDMLMYAAIVVIGSSYFVADAIVRSKTKEGDRK